MLRRQPGFAIIAILTLALGIGANTAVFTVVNGVLLRPLPYGDPDRLVVLLNGRAGRVSPWFSPLNYIDVTTQSNAFAETAAFDPISVNLTGRGDPQRVDGAEVTWPFFSVLNATPRMGRAFLESDAASDAPVIVVSDGFWRRELGKRPDAVGAKIQMDGTEYTVIGVAPPDVALPRRAQFWRPLVFTPDQLAPRSRGAQWVSAVARLKPGVGLEQANSAMAVVAGRLADQFPLNSKDRLMTATPLHDQIVRDVRPALLVLLGAVMLVLLIACVNVANLLLARAYGRARSAVRAALGAGRVVSSSSSSPRASCSGSRVVRLDCWSRSGARARSSRSARRRFPGCRTSGSIGVCLIHGRDGGRDQRSVRPCAGRRQCWRRDGALVIGAGRGSIGSAGTRTRKTLVVAEMALAVVLLVGAGLLVRSYERIVGVNPGFSPDRVLTFQLALPDAKYMAADSREQFVSGFVNRLRQEGGVESASAIMGLPLDSDFSISSSFRRSGEPDSVDTPSAWMRIITPDYFKTLKIPLRAGRIFNEHDDAMSPEVVIINEQAARRFWPGQDPIGQEIRLGVRLVRGARSGQKTIVGIIGDVNTAAWIRPLRRKSICRTRSISRGSDDRGAHCWRSACLRADCSRRSRRGRSRTSPLRDSPHDRHRGALGRGASIHDAAPRVFRVGGVMLAGIGVYGLLAMW
jgi:hypothetical protein